LSTSGADLQYECSGIIIVKAAVKEHCKKFRLATSVVLNCTTPYDFFSFFPLFGSGALYYRRELLLSDVVGFDFDGVVWDGSVVTCMFGMPVCCVLCCIASITVDRRVLKCKDAGGCLPMIFE
jgi:hypothetical protein